MAHDVFISYSTKDKNAADAVCGVLESKKVRCWIAPRDVKPGVKWANALIEAIDQCTVFCLVISANSNQYEIERAKYGEVGIPPRLEHAIDDVKKEIDRLETEIGEARRRLAALGFS